MSQHSDHDEKVAAASWRNYLLRNKSVIVDLYQGQLKSTLTCLHCRTTSIKFEPFMFLSLPVDPARPTIKRSLELFTAVEQLESNNGWYCTHCQKFRRAMKKLDLWKIPPVLIIHLKRFKYDPRRRQNRKIERTVQYDMNMDLMPYVASQQDGISKYNLFAMASHHGTIQKGHYTATVRNSLNHQWYTISDNEVRNANRHGVERNRDAYLLFYARESLDQDESFPRQSLTMPEHWPHSSTVTKSFKTSDDKVKYVKSQSTERTIRSHLLQPASR